MKVTHSVTIHASPDIVWSATTALERWPEWNPNVSEVARQDSGPLEIGSRALIKQNGLPDTVWTVTALEAKRHFAWDSRIRGVPMVASHAIEHTGASARSRLEVEVPGFLALMLWPLLRPALQRSIEAENGGLKAFCERLAAGGTAASDLPKP